MNNTVKNKILVSAYAVNPSNGSEDGMGWNFINQIARFNQVIAITRENTRPHIERYMAEFPCEYYQNIKFVYYDLPKWARFWKRGGRGAMLYYYLWQYFLPAHVKKLKLEFDIVHNLNFHNDWTPSRLWKLNKPFVWGPIGHHSKIPKDYILHVYGFKNYLIEQIKWGIKKYFWLFDPMLRQTIKHADTVLAMNSSVGKVLPQTQPKVVYMPSVSTECPLSFSHDKSLDKFKVLSAGRFVPLKGFDITIKSFARFKSKLPLEDQTKIELILVGDGPYKKYLHRLVDELELNGQVKFISWLQRSDFKKLYQDAHVFLFPSHEGAGMVVAESLSYGVPVVCFKNDGPGEFIDATCGITIPYSRYNTSITEFSNALVTLYQNPAMYNELSNGAFLKFKEKFDWNLKGEHLLNVYNTLSSKAV